MGALSTTIVTTEAALTGLAEAWWGLWRRCPVATPFQSPAWLIPWWRAFRPGALRTAAVHEGDALVALAPLYREEGALGRRLLPLGVSVSDYLDVLVDPACPAAGPALVRAMADADRWDTLGLEELAPGAAALALAAPAGVRDAVEPQSPCPVLTLPAGAGRLGEVVPASTLRNLRTARRRAERRRGFAIEAVGSGAMGAFLDDLFRLHRARWAARGEAGVLDDPRVRAFHQEAAPALAAAGLARCLAMRMEEQVVGAYYGFADGARAYYYLGGFDPAFGFESPGTLLLGQAVEAAAADRLAEFHFLRGQEAYKYQWGAVDRWSVRRVLARDGAVA